MLRRRTFEDDVDVWVGCGSNFMSLCIELFRFAYSISSKINMSMTTPINKTTSAMSALTASSDAPSDLMESFVIVSDAGK